MGSGKKGLCLTERSPPASVVPISLWCSLFPEREIVKNENEGQLSTGDID